MSAMRQVPCPYSSSQSSQSAGHRAAAAMMSSSQSAGHRAASSDRDHESNMRHTPNNKWALLTQSIAMLKFNSESGSVTHLRASLLDPILLPHARREKFPLVYLSCPVCDRPSEVHHSEFLCAQRVCQRQMTANKGRNGARNRRKNSET